MTLAFQNLRRHRMEITPALSKVDTELMWSLGFGLGDEGGRLFIGSAE